MSIWAPLFAVMFMLASCVDEDGAGVPAPKSMFIESAEYNVDLTNDETKTLTLRWIDVENATYKVSLSNQENDIIQELSNPVTAGDLSVLSMDIPYEQLASYVETAGLNGIVGCDFFINVTGTPVDLSKPTALAPSGSTARSTVHYVE
ncbi:MAG: hypothetical protein IJ196_05445 [Prevotella sp.]|nr:hypothetical protein [Prevotella sp.]